MTATVRTDGINVISREINDIDIDTESTFNFTLTFTSRTKNLQPKDEEEFSHPLLNHCHQDVSTFILDATSQSKETTLMTSKRLN